MATRARLTTTAKIPSQMIATLVEQPSTSSCSFVSDSSWLFLSPAHQVSENHEVRHMKCSINIARPFFRCPRKQGPAMLIEKRKTFENGKQRTTPNSFFDSKECFRLNLLTFRISWPRVGAEAYSAVSDFLRRAPGTSKTVVSNLLRLFSSNFQLNRRHFALEVVVEPPWWR